MRISDGWRRPAVIWLLAVGLLARSSAAQSETVDVQGSGLTKQEAINDALRKAVETGGLNKLYSESKVENFQLVKDIILTQANGLVSHYDVLGESRADDGVWAVKIRATVDKSEIDATWAHVTILMKQIGKPKIMLFFDDRKRETSQSEPKPFDKKSVVPTTITKVLTDSGFRVFDRSRFALAQKANIDWRDDHQLANLKRLEMEKEGADLYIDGWGIAEGPTPKRASGLNGWKTVIQAEVVWSDTAEVVTAIKPVQHEKNYTDAQEADALELLAIGAEETGFQIKAALLHALNRRALEGVYFTVKVEGVSDKALDEIEAKLRNLEEVGEVDLRVSSGEAAEWEVEITQKPNTFVRAVKNMELDCGKLELKEFQGRTAVFRLTKG